MTIISCSEIDCDRDARKRGMCTMHYQRATKAEKPCSIPGCTNGNASRTTGYCQTHHKRLMKHGDPMVSMKGNAHKVRHTEDGLRICKACGEGKPVTEYHKDSSGTDGYRAQCKPCRNGYMAGYYADNRETRMAYEQYRRTHRAEHMRALDMARYERNKEKRIELATASAHVRRARLAVQGSDVGVTRNALRERDGDDCFYCKQEMDFSRAVGRKYKPNHATVEHLTPISAGGGHTWENCVLACRSCNLRRNKTPLEVWLEAEVNANVAS